MVLGGVIVGGEEGAYGGVKQDTGGTASVEITQNSADEEEEVDVESYLPQECSSVDTVADKLPSREEHDGDLSMRDGFLSCMWWEPGSRSLCIDMYGCSVHIGPDLVTCLDLAKELLEARKTARTKTQQPITDLCNIFDRQGKGAKENLCAHVFHAPTHANFRDPCDTPQEEGVQLDDHSVVPSEASSEQGGSGQ